MKLDPYFRELLTNTVNLPLGKLTQMESRVDAVYAALAADEEIGGVVESMDPQGSWAQKTLIKPRPGREFDADFMLVMTHVADWDDSPKQYIDAVYQALMRHGTYSKLNPTRKCRCVRITYANDFHIDIVPFVDHPWRNKVIVNRDEDVWERTDPQGFTDWMQAKDSTASGNLRRVIRLVKYVRDHRSDFTGTRSILLTTLLGERVSTLKTFAEPGCYGSTPTALKNIVGDLDEWLQAQGETMPIISDPAGTGLTFNHRWSDESYRHFRMRIHTLAADITAAHDEPNKDESVRLWQAIFGEGFRPPPSTASSGRFGAVAPPVGRSGRGG